MREGEVGGKRCSQEYDLMVARVSLSTVLSICCERWEVWLRLRPGLTLRLREKINSRTNRQWSGKRDLANCCQTFIFQNNLKRKSIFIPFTLSQPKLSQLKTPRRSGLKFQNEPFSLSGTICEMERNFTGWSVFYGRENLSLSKQSCLEPGLDFLKFQFPSFAGGRNDKL